ncbi:Protein LSM12 [Galdieria sulphuraria]|uniref:AD domain-containing protein n=1 Tax=Galdieria sulphuraria TaxID=130081 RepID=M2XZB7_GALSU|nr:uncharacterized protein Gasu_36520 [Galdieria sulphuraria]EME28914.1 hypothetical protein Gasu_36520 [Galdieria sulphuraria]GJD08304.1 Protein LSM12 [Galdieria sulphuraria]|eukprot:XP_005705434.1 hypothetical protein Gasu_36520 [Galdieria sulphuraria]
MQVDDWIVGLEVEIFTFDGKEYRGIVYTYDADANCVVLARKSQDSLKSDLRILKASLVKNINVLGRSNVDQLPQQLSPLNLEALKMREEQALQKARKDLARTGVGVSQQAQEIFDALCKTLPCQWEEDSIVIFENIKLKKPYRVEDLEGSEIEAVNRVKVVLENELQKLQRRNT